MTRDLELKTPGSKSSLYSVTDTLGQHGRAIAIQ